ncbi:MAG: F0F1 ATP synthase subunit epsilon [Sphingomonadales bacterium]|jgi:F-type H+-transporting ATPase subunit epsilon
MLLEIITPEKSLFKGEVNSVSLPGLDGVFQVLNHHAPIISSLKSGELRFEAANTVEATEFLQVSGTAVSVQIKGGVAELNNQKLIVLAE